MKKVLLPVFIFMSLFIFSPLCFAADSTDLTDTFNHLGFSPTSYTFDNCNVSIDGALISVEKSYGRDTGDKYFVRYKDFLTKYRNFVIAVGMSITVTNNTDDALLINFGKSVFTLGNIYSGIPFTGGVRVKDAGNPAATPDAVIPPKQKKSIWLINPQSNTVTHQFPVGEYLSSTTSPIVSFYMCTTSPSGATVYHMLTSSPVILNSVPMPNTHYIAGDWLKNRLNEIKKAQRLS